MRAYANGEGWQLFTGDCRTSMMYIPDSSVDSVVCDPPYELGFMGKSWDSTGIANDSAMWAEVLRVLKPGGHLLAFSGSRTYHRMVCAIEDAGFEIRDQIMWVYGSGFPKSLDVSKAIDKAAGVEREVVGQRQHPTLIDKSKIDRQGRLPNHGANTFADEWALTSPATDAARQWEGWGTALKPAHEPIVMARKPLIGTVAANVQAHGVGAINIDACRVDAEEGGRPLREVAPMRDGICYQGNALAGRADGSLMSSMAAGVTCEGRWPANLIHDGSDEVLTAFPDAKGQQGDLIGHSNTRQSPNGCYGEMSPAADHIARRDTSTSAARFFYCAKTSKSDRNAGCDDILARPLLEVGALRDGNRPSAPRANNHPTVKPNDLMRYLCRLVTPPNGTVFDPFTGSGSTGRAALQEGFKFIGCELSDEYSEIAKARMGAACV